MSTDDSTKQSHKDDEPKAPKRKHSDKDEKPSTVVNNDAAANVDAEDDKKRDDQDDKRPVDNANDSEDATAQPARSEQPDPKRVAATLDDPAQQRDPLLQIAKNQFIAHQDYEAETVVCPVCQAEFNPGAPVL